MQNKKRTTTALIRDLIAILFLLLGGTYFIYIAAHGYLTNQASTIGKDSPWLSRADYPMFFWISIIFHAMAGIYALRNSAKMLTRVLPFLRKKQLLPNAGKPLQSGAQQEPH